MQWHRVRIDVSPDHADYVGDALWKAGSRGVEFLDPFDLFWMRSPRMPDEIEDGSCQHVIVGNCVGVVGYFPSTSSLENILSSIHELLDRGSVPSPSVKVEQLDDAEWEENWKRYFRPIRLGERILVVPEWEVVSACSEDIVVRLDPGMAFGTGSHPTTSMCVEFLEQCVRSGVSVIDLGTGSGILAIVSALLGARRVTAIDIDPVAVERAVHNVKLNALEDVVTVAEGDLVSSVGSHRYEIVVANIVASAIIRLLPCARRVMSPDGILLISGIIRDRERECIESALSCGFSVERVRRAGEWVAAVLHM